MIYLNLIEGDGRPQTERPYRSDGWDTGTEWYYPLLDAGNDLIDGWFDVPYTDDGIVSGVLADWCDEHRDTLLSGATGPSDPAERLDRLIDWLRRRCTHPAEV